MIVEAQEHDGLPQMARRQYMEGYERHNVLYGKVWNTALAKQGAALLAPRLADRIVVICGVQTLGALQLPRPSDWCTWVESEPHATLFTADDLSFRYALIPHPSGRCREYNDPNLKMKTGRMLLDALQDAERGI